MNNITKLDIGLILFGLPFLLGMGFRFGWLFANWVTGKKDTAAVININKGGYMSRQQAGLTR